MTAGINRRHALIGLLATGTAAASELYVPRRGARQLNEREFDAVIPSQIADWRSSTGSGLILPPQDQLSRALYEQLLTRVYATGAATPPVMIAIAYSSVQAGRLQVHRPDVCYPAAGFTIASNELVDVEVGPGLSIPARFIVADRGSRRECVLYWTRIGPTLATRWSQQRWIMASANLQGYIVDGLLARLSVISTDLAGARQQLEAFLRELLLSASPFGQKLLIGKQLDGGRWM